MVRISSPSVKRKRRVLTMTVIIVTVACSVFCLCLPVRHLEVFPSVAGAYNPHMPRAWLRALFVSKVAEYQVQGIREVAGWHSIGKGGMDILEPCCKSESKRLPIGVRAPYAGPASLLRVPSLLKESLLPPKDGCTLEAIDTKKKRLDQWVGLRQSERPIRHQGCGKRLRCCQGLSC